MDGRKIGRLYRTLLQAGAIKKQELRLCSAHSLMLTDIYMKFCEDTLKGFQVEKSGHECDRQMDRQMCGGKTIYLPTLGGRRSFQDGGHLGFTIRMISAMFDQHNTSFF